MMEDNWILKTFYRTNNKPSEKEKLKELQLLDVYMGYWNTCINKYTRVVDMFMLRKDMRIQIFFFFDIQGGDGF